MLFRTRPNIPDLQLFLQMTNFSLVTRLHQSQPANHRNPRIQIKRLPLSSSVANPAPIQTKLQKTTLSSTFKITRDNCASSISPSCRRHSSDFKTISVCTLIQRPRQNKGGKTTVARTSSSASLSVRSTTAAPKTVPQFLQHSRLLLYRPIHFQVSFNVKAS